MFCHRHVGHDSRLFFLVAGYLAVSDVFVCCFLSFMVREQTVENSSLVGSRQYNTAGGYGMGFLKAFFYKVLLGRGRDEAEEVRLRKGK